jgi:protein-S-isoprenylcysteine O-methyltransferase Ste14
MSRWRHARAIALLPGTVTIVVPGLLVAGDDLDLVWGLEGVAAALVALAGAALVVGGLAMWAWTVRLLARIGKGTLAPWDPTRRLVVEGPYRHVRNPMITAVLAVLLGEAVLLGSTAVLVWVATVFVINHVYFQAIEEPGLRERFGDEYVAYQHAVPRWVPRRKPWSP